MHISSDGLRLIASFEGCRLTSYKDVVGVCTIGYGHTSGVHLGMLCTQEQAEKWLMEDLDTAENFINTVVKVSLTQGEFDALVSFVFNLGIGNVEHSTLLRLVNAGDFAGAAKQFPRWDFAGGNVNAGLLHRRLAEQAEFEGKDVTST